MLFNIIHQFFKKYEKPEFRKNWEEFMKTEYGWHY